MQGTIFDRFLVQRAPALAEPAILQIDCRRTNQIIANAVPIHAGDLQLRLTRNRRGELEGFIEVGFQRGFVVTLTSGELLIAQLHNQVRV